MMGVGGSGERESGVHPPPSLVRPTAGVSVSLGTRRNAEGCVHTGGSSAG